MIVAYTAYAKVAVPILEGPPTVVRRSQIAGDYPDTTEILDKTHLPSIVPTDAWELGSCKTLLTPQGTVYFEYWEPVDDEGTYQLMPFTIVINDPVNSIREAENDTTQPKPAPIVLRSLEGARLKFSKPLTARSKKDDIELESAQLDGQVTLFRPANPGTDEDEMRIVTRNIQINRSQIFTLSEVHFAFGPHHGSGRNLSIQLAHATKADSPTKSFSNIDGVEQMELAFVSELVLQPVDANAFKLANENPASDKPSAASLVDDKDRVLSLSNQETPLRLSCDGPFVFRMAEKKAWFRDNVVVTQLDEHRDNLRCDSLQIELSRDDISQTTSVKNLIAIGTPEKPATIVSNSQQTLVVGEELNFDVQQSLVKAFGSQPVTIRSPKFAFQGSRLEYQLAENGKLGALSADGPGILKGLSEDDKNFEVKWERSLTTRNSDAERVLIEIDENASVKFDQRNSIAADHLSFTVWQLPDPESVKENQKWKYFPSKLETRGNVRIVSEKLDGSANELTANWEKPSFRQLGTINHKVSYRGTFRAAPQQADGFRALPSQSPTMKFSGDKVVANVAGGMNQLRIRDLVVDGSLALESTATDKLPFAIAGQSMRLVPQANDLYRVTITGDDSRPATFRTNGLDLRGSNLQLDQTANTIWIQGKGDLNIDGTKQSATVASRELPKLESANISWTGGMVFDGSRIYFENDVELFANRPPNADGQSSKLKSNSEALTIELTESIRFENLDPVNGVSAKRAKPEIQRMVFVNQVDQASRAFKLAGYEKSGQAGRDDAASRRVIGFQNATMDASGNVVELQKLFVPMATVDAISGDVVASGPGQALAYQFSNGNSRLSGFSRDAATGGTTSKPKLTCVHARFDGQLTANTEQNTMRIDRNTRSAWANVDRFDQTLDPDRPDQLPLGAAVLKSDALKFAQWTPRNSEPRQEMQAEGNTSIQSELFEAVADRMTYSDDTDILIIEGNPPANARLSWRRTSKSQPETLLAKKVKYRLSDQWTEVSDIRSVQAGLDGK